MWAIITWPLKVPVGTTRSTVFCLPTSVVVAPVMNTGAVVAASTLTWAKNDDAAKNSATAYNATHAFMGTRGNVTILLTKTALRSK